MEQIIDIFIKLVKSEICGKTLESEVIKKAADEFTQEMWLRLYMLACKHDYVHVLAVALKKNGLINKIQIGSEFSKSMKIALLRYESLQFEQEQIFEVFEQEHITYVPLKGAVIRAYYPQPWMRTSCDIDILVKECELEQAKNTLEKLLGYRTEKYNFHDVSMFSPAGTHVELHFKIEESIEKVDGLLGKVWDYVSPVQSGSYRYEMSAEYLMFHSYAHMMYHFAEGGCGVRYIVDAWLLRQKLTFDEAVLEELLTESGMKVFAEYVDKLTRVWFGNDCHDEVTAKMQEYIFEGGVFGSEKTQVAARKTQRSENGKYLLWRIFQPYKEMAMTNTKLAKHPILYPYYTVKRWMKLLDKDIARQARSEVWMNQNIGQDSIQDLKQLFERLDL